MRFFLLLSLFLIPQLIFAQSDWPYVGGDAGRLRYSKLRQIDRTNVQKLEVAWTLHTGGLDPKINSAIQCTPIVVEGVMYLTGPTTEVLAVDPATGRVKWRFDPKRTKSRNLYNRGVAWWSDGKRNGARRILLAIPDGQLFSLDARTGQPDPAFGDDGKVELRAGMERELKDFVYGATSAPVVFENLVILGLSVGEGPAPAAPGDIRAFDVKTGRQAWRFRTVPPPGEVGHETWVGDSWRNRGGVNPWGGLSVDLARGLVFAGLGSASFDFFGGDRHGDNLFANSVLALDARTGRRRWHYQTVHHDLWDYDLPVPPTLVRVKHDGRWRDAAVQVTKTGFVYLFDRVTGRPLFEIVEREVPASSVPNEQAARTQPIPVKPPPLVPQEFNEDQLTNISAEARAAALKKIAGMKIGGFFAPPSLEGTVQLPGYRGGATWSGASYDPETGLLFVNVNNIANLNQLFPAEPGRGFPYVTKGAIQLRDDQGYPGTRPPWGLLVAVDLNRGEIRWRVPLGEYAELTARGIPPTGTENFGGSIVTAGGLVFIASTADEKFRAFDKETGKKLWEAQLPAGGYAAPCTYEVNGRQYVVIAAGGGGKVATKPGDAYLAFALPIKSRD